MANCVATTTLLTSIPILDDVLQTYRFELERDLTGYRNHVYRVANLCAAIADPDADIEKIAVAAVFHDLGIWTDKTFDYLRPSKGLADEYLSARGCAAWIAEIGAMIEEHHKITAFSADPQSLVESFRRADWIDVTRGVRSFGVDRRLIQSVFAMWPSAGFHRRLVTFTVERFRTHPLQPLPMVRL